MALPKDILARAERVYAYHRASKYLFGAEQGPPSFENIEKPNWSAIFPDYPVTPLPMDLLDVSAGTLSLMETSLEALPDTFVAPRQNLRTLASWLYLADGVLNRGTDREASRRTWDSEGSTYPTHLYVAVFELDDLEPGLYHYCPQEFALRKLRDGQDPLNHLKRGRPDLAFLKSAPAALLVSTPFARATWRYGTRAYRTALIDAGKLTQNLTTCANGLGIQTMTRLRLTESTMRELIGLSERVPFIDAEAVQSMVVWADRVHRDVEAAELSAETEAADLATVDLEVDAEADVTSDDVNDLTDIPIDPAPAETPTAVPRKSLNHGALSFSSVLTPELVLPNRRRLALPPLARAAQQANVATYGSVTAVHQDCVAAGVAVRLLRPPVTEISPLPADATAQELPPLVRSSVGEPLRKTLLGYREPAVFSRHPLPRDLFRRMVCCSLAAGTFFPLFPDGPQMGLVRALWIISAVGGFERGLWYYDGRTDGWFMLRGGSFRFDAQFMAMDDGRFGSAAAVCMLAAGLPSILGLAGPDTYRLALLEAGTASHRMRLAAAALGAASVSTSTFYDDELRSLFGLGATGWEPFQMIAVGVPE